MHCLPLPSRRLTLFLLTLAVLVAGSVLGYAPDPREDYSFHAWVPSDVTKTHEVLGTAPKTCGEFELGSVCAEYRSWVSGDVAGVCCLFPSDLGSTDPRRCLIGATYDRDTAPIE